MSMISPVHSHYHEGSPMSKEEKLSEKDLFKKVGVFSLEWKSDGWRE